MDNRVLGRGSFPGARCGRLQGAAWRRVRSGRRPEKRGWRTGVACFAVLVLVLTAAPPADADESEGLGDVFLLGGGLGSLPVLFDQVAPAAASESGGARTALVVWEDHRSGEADIFAARLDSSGTLLDTASLPLATGSAVQTAPAVAFGTESYLVVWAVEEPEQWSIRGLRVAPDGSLLDAEPITVASSVERLEGPAVAFDGSDYMVIWSDWRDGQGDLYSARISTEGGLLDPIGSRVASGQGDLIDVSLTYGEGDYLVVWADEYLEYGETDTTLTSDIDAVLLSPSGATGDSVLTIASTEVFESVPAVAFDGTEFLVVWAHRRDAGTQFIFARRVATDGAVTADSLDIAREINGQERGFRQTPGIAFDDLNFLVTWGLTLSFRGIYGATVVLTDETAEISDRITIDADLLVPESVLHWDGVRYVLAYSAGPAGALDVGVSYVEADEATASPAQTISLGTPAQVPVSVAFGGGNYFSVWEEQCEAGWRARAGRVTPGGTPLDPEGIDLLPDTCEVRRNPSVAYGADAFLLTWADAGTGRSTVRARLIDLDGDSLSPVLDLDAGATLGTRPVVAWDGSNYLVTWISSADPIGLRATRLAAPNDSLHLLDEAPIVLRSGAGLTDAGLCFDGSQYFVVWGETTEEVRGAWVSDSLSVIAEAVIAAARAPGRPDVTFDGSLYQVIWRDDGSSIYTIRVHPSGEVYDPGPLRLSSQAGPGEEPTVVFDGNTRLALWREASDGIWRLTGARIGAGGSVQAPGIFTVADEFSMQRWPLAVAGETGNLFIVYSSLVLSAEHSSLRIGGKLWQQAPPELEIAVHQNPAVTSDIAVYLMPSEALDSLSVYAYANGAPLGLTVTDSERGIHRGWYRALATDIVTILAGGRDLAGNLGEATRTFAVAVTTPEEGGLLAGPHEVVSLLCPPGAMKRPTTLLMLPDPSWDAGLVAPADPAAAQWEFLLSPPGLVLEHPALLAIELPTDCRPAAALPGAGATATTADWTLVIERATPSGWEAVPASWSAESGMAEASITRLGRFRARWESATGTTARLALALGPDPFRGDLSLRFRLPQTGQAQLAIFDVSGRRVRTLLDGSVPGGWNQLIWNGRDGAGRPVGSGVYFARLRFAEESVTRRCLLVR